MLSWDSHHIISGFFELKRLKHEMQKSELAVLDAEIALAEIEAKIIAAEPPEIRPYVAHEFEMNRALGRMLPGYGMPAEHCIERGRLWAKLLADPTPDTNNTKEE